MGRFSGKRVLITGAMDRIALAGAKRIVEEGGAVAVTINSRENFQRARRDLPPTATILDNGAADDGTAGPLAERAKQLGAFDGFWLNPGSDQVASTNEMDEEFFDRMIHANVRRPSLLMARLADLLKPGGSIVLTALTAYERSPMASLYAATEGAMMSMARCWAAALANRNIRAWADQHQPSRRHAGGVPLAGRGGFGEFGAAQPNRNTGRGG